MKKLGRIDFVITPIVVDEEARRVQVRIEPNPERYQIVEIEGGLGYLDLHTTTIIPEAMMWSAVERMSSNSSAALPMHFLPPTIKSLPPYSSTRLAAVVRQLTTGDYEPPSEKAKTHVELEESTTEKHVTFLSIDICKSTILRNQDPSSFDRSHEVFIQELATLVGQYNGTILKFTGDGFIAYIDYPAFTVQADTAAALGIALTYHLENCVNPALKAAGLIELSMRVGAEFGLAKAKRFNIQAIGKTQTDFVSDALNFAVKIQESCGVNEFRVGQALRDLLHQDLIEKLIKVDFDSKDISRNDYRIYRF